jgi:hypothetical protein
MAQQIENPGAFIQALEWIEALPFAEAVRTSVWLFPALESVHVLAIVFVVGSIARVDLRLLGAIQRDRPITQVSAELLPWTWTSFAVALVTGLLLWAAHAVRYTGIIFFDIKMVLLVLAGLNMFYFQLVTHKNVAQWDIHVKPPFEARLAGALSLVFWIGVITTGRFIGFV